MRKEHIGCVWFTGWMGWNNSILLLPMFGSTTHGWGHSRVRIFLQDSGSAHSRNGQNAFVPFSRHFSLFLSPTLLSISLRCGSGAWWAVTDAPARRATAAREAALAAATHMMGSDRATVVDGRARAGTERERERTQGIWRTLARGICSGEEWRDREEGHICVTCWSHS